MSTITPTTQVAYTKRLQVTGLAQNHPTRTYRGTPACLGSVVEMVLWTTRDDRTPAQLDGAYLPYQADGFASDACAECGRTDLSSTNERGTNKATTHLPPKDLRTL